MQHIRISKEFYAVTCPLTVGIRKDKTIRDNAPCKIILQGNRYIGMYYLYVKYLMIKQLREQGHKWGRIAEIINGSKASSRVVRNMHKRYESYHELIEGDEWMQWIAEGLYPVTIKTSTDRMVYKLYRTIPERPHHAYRYEKGVPQADCTRA